MRLLRILERNLPFEKPLTQQISATDICGSAACHFQVGDDSSLSMFRVGNEPPTSQDIAIAIAAMRKDLDEVVWCLAEESLVAEVGVAINPSPGKTPVDLVNKKHVNVSNVTLSRLTEMILVFVQSDRREELAMPEVAIALIDAMSTGSIAAEELPAGLRKSIDIYKNGRAYKRARRMKDAGFVQTAERLKDG